MAAGTGNEPTAPRNGREHTVRTKILEAGANEEQAWAHVAGWIGPEEHPRQRLEEWISVVFQVELDRLRIEAAHQGCPCEITWPPGGLPRLRLLDPQDEAHVVAELAELKQSAREAVVEEATARVFCRLVGVEWRTQEEVDLERGEDD